MHLKNIFSDGLGIEMNSAGLTTYARCMTCQLAEQLSPRRIGDGYNTGMGNAPFHRHRIKLVRQFLTAPYYLHSKLGHGLNLKRYGYQEHTVPLAPKGGHERAVVTASIFSN
jgi:hypothetical protein